MSELSTNWYESTLGKSLIDSSITCVQRLLPKQNYRVILQVAGPPVDSYLNIFDADLRIKIGDLSDSNRFTTIIADPEWLPISARSTDLIFLPHSLEFCENPHNLLREVAECIVSEGLVVVAGFNPKSMLGGLKFLGFYSDLSLHHAKFYSIERVRDWFTLLGFEPVAGEYIYFRPPLTEARNLQRFKSMEVAGYRWWPGFGSVYILAVKKKDLGFRMNASEMLNKKLKQRGVLHPITERKFFYGDIKSE